jgi:hypothetical protein
MFFIFVKSKTTFATMTFISRITNFTFAAMFFITWIIHFATTTMIHRFIYNNTATQTLSKLANFVIFMVVVVTMRF